MLDFIKKYLCILVNIIGALIICVTIFNDELICKGGRLVIMGIFTFLTYWYLGYLLAVLLLVLNIAAMQAVKKDSLDAGVLLAIPFGGFGAIIGLSENPDFFNKTAVKIIFSVQLWVVIWLVVSFMLYVKYF